MSQPVVLVGSSIFQQWYLAQDILPYETTINLAVGGTTTLDWVPWIAKQVLPLKPKVLMFYAGSNDLNCEYTPTDIIARTQSMLNQVHEALPDCRMYYFSVIRAPQKQPLWDQVDQINDTLNAFAQQQDWLQFIDINQVFHDSAGNVLEDLFVEDQLHLTHDAYSRMLQYTQAQITG